MRAGSLGLQPVQTGLFVRPVDMFGQKKKKLERSQNENHHLELCVIYGKKTTPRC